MNPPLGVIVKNSTQRNFLVELLQPVWPGRLIDLAGFDELKSLSSSQRFGLLYLELTPDNPDLIDWLFEQRDPVIGIINRNWKLPQLEPYIDTGLEDYLIKPFQPEKISKQLRRFVSIYL